MRSTGFRVAWVAAAACSLGAQPQCDVRTQGPPCDDLFVVVEPGTCVEIPDPCGRGWGDLATLSFTNAPDGLWFEVQRRPAGTTVSICAADTVGLSVSDPATIRIVGSSGGFADIGV